MTSLDQASLPAIVDAAARGAAEIQAENIVVLDVGDVFGITDHFVIASGSNPRQVRRIAEEIEAHVRAAGGEGAKRVEGVREAVWILLDFGEFVAHVFHTDTRSFYDLERLWSDVPRLDWVDPEAPPSSTASGQSMSTSRQ
jgi:ribosome-associated protein